MEGGHRRRTCPVCTNWRACQSEFHPIYTDNGGKRKKSNSLTLSSQEKISINTMWLTPFDNGWHNSLSTKHKYTHILCSIYMYVCQLFLQQWVRYIHSAIKNTDSVPTSVYTLQSTQVHTHTHTHTPQRAFHREERFGSHEDSSLDLKTCLFTLHTKIEQIQRVQIEFELSLNTTNLNWIQLKLNKFELNSKLNLNYNKCTLIQMNACWVNMLPTLQQLRSCMLWVFPLTFFVKCNYTYMCILEKILEHKV